jgi:hypothetical protein
MYGSTTVNASKSLMLSSFKRLCWTAGLFPTFRCRMRNLFIRELAATGVGHVDLTFISFCLVRYLRLLSFTSFYSLLDAFVLPVT